jgi:hypothetical protein
MFPMDSRVVNRKDTVKKKRDREIDGVEVTVTTTAVVDGGGTMVVVGWG